MWVERRMEKKKQLLPEDLDAISESTVNSVMNQILASFYPYRQKERIITSSRPLESSKKVRKNKKHREKHSSRYRL